MSFLLGYYDFSNNYVDSVSFKSAMNEMKYWEPDLSKTWINGQVAFGQHSLFTTKESMSSSLPFYDKNTGCCIIADARIDYREALTARLSLSWDKTKYWPDSKFILEAYLKWGVDCPKYLFGDFAFAIWDNSKNLLFCARDHIGIKPLYYFKDENKFLVFNDIGVMSTFQEGVNSKWIEKRCHGIIQMNTTTFYNKVFKLPPAHYLICNNDIVIKKYWRLSSQRKKNIDNNEVLNKLKEIFSNAVKERMRSRNAIATELSGGLDSSSITTVAHLLRAKLECKVFSFSHTISEDARERFYPFGDESEYINELVNSINLANHKNIDSKTVGAFSSFKYALKLLLYPPVNHYPVLSDDFYNEVKYTGCRVLLSGHGGDEGLTNRSFEYLNELGLNNEWQKIYKLLNPNYDRLRLKKLLKFMKFYFKIKLRNIKLLKYSIKAFIELCMLNNRVYVFENNFIKWIRIKSEVFFSKIYTARLYFILNSHKKVLLPHICNRMEDSSVLTRAHQLEYRYPFLDVKLLEFYYSIPEHIMRKYGSGRELFRTVMMEILPEKIIERDSGFGSIIPNGLSRMELDENSLREFLIEEDGNSSNHFVHVRRLQKLMIKFPGLFKGKDLNVDLKVFYTSVCLTILQKWQREGKIDIGIKC